MTSSTDTPGGRAPPTWLLRLRGFGVAFGQKVVLASIDFDVPPRGVVTLVAGAGEGKSTLLRTLAGLNDPQPDLRTWGEATYEGEPLGLRRPALVLQHARLLTATVRENLVSALPDRSSLTRLEQDVRIAGELASFGLDRFASDLGRPVIELASVEQRLLSIVRAVSTGARLVMLDEPTADLDAEASLEVADLIAQVARVIAVIVVTHDQRVARRIGGRVSLLAGGRILETRNAASFYDMPATLAARDFVRSGRCSVPSPDARPEDLSPTTEPPPPLPSAARAAVSARVGPNGFHWLIPGVIGGLPRPGVVRSLESDLEGLERLGVTRLVTLEEKPAFADEVLAPYGISGQHFPIDDMDAPPVDAAIELLTGFRSRLAAGEVIALHCLAGKGRTGTLLAGYLLLVSGCTALEALDRVRAIQPRWVQSDAQIRFLSELDQALSKRTDRPGADALARLFATPPKRQP
ncbi:MAG: ATP-binding cassette domain-containing protein [Myxococcales bacterium]|nr:ATP-binding cassette domain-containing protein [Myxococcales bacterium]